MPNSAQHTRAVRSWSDLDTDTRDSITYMAPRLQIIICATREGRVGPSVARWFDGFVREHGSFEGELVDLRELALPMFDEPRHPKMKQYEHEHTKRWSEMVSAADAHVFVTPEYNYMPPPAFVNAVDYLSQEWSYKSAGFVSYGGVSGGLRATQIARLHVTTVRMMPVPETVMVPMVKELIDDAGLFHSNALIDLSARTMLDEMLRWTDALKPLRA